MRRFSRHLITAWIACLAILFGALAPTLSHAMARAAPDSLDFPICSAAGHTVQEVQHAYAHAYANTDASKPAGEHTEHGVDPFQHCPCCADQHHSPGLPPSMPAALVAVQGQLRPLLFYTAPTALFQWTAPQSRAPPTLS